MTRLNERELELVAMLSEECETPAEITTKLKALFAGTFEKNA